MYGIRDLKHELIVTESTVSCPCRECPKVVERQRNLFQRKREYFCPNHGIYISPSTFEYEGDAENILWDYHILADHMKSKRESRIGRDNSEDAVTWNVFRYMERQNLLLTYLSNLSNVPLREAKTIYWSHDRATQAPWEPLWEARKVFEVDPSRGSEPDLIVLTDRMLFFIEAKLTASNNTQPSRSGHLDKYVSGGDGWWNQAFIPGTDSIQIAERERKYELMRFWLLGTWMAKHLNRDFMLINLVRETSEKKIEEIFRQWLPPIMSDHFRRITWEDIFGFILAEAGADPDRGRILDYFQNKTVGYRQVGGYWRIQRAFSV